MNSVPSLVSEAYRLFHLDLITHLEEVENLADRYDCWTDDQRETAHHLLVDLVETIRVVLGEHGADQAGRCKTCPGAQWPCPVVGTIHNEIKRPEHHLAELLDRAIAARAPVMPPG